MEGWQVLVVVFVILGLLLAIVFAIGSSSNARANKYEQLTFQRGERIAQLLEREGLGLTQNANDPELFRLLREAPIENARLLSKGGWFERSEAGLAKLLGGNDRSIVDWFFVCFERCWHQGSRQELLLWIDKTANTYLTDTAALDTLVIVITRLANRFTQSEADWIYQRALEMIGPPRNGSAAARTFALRVGRFRYSHSRPDRVPTVYDEQAIANDISARAR